MDNIKVNLNEEYDRVVELAVEKFGYGEDLKGVLRRILPAMLEGRSFEDRQLFYKMLSHTPIAVIPENTELTTGELNEQYLGNLNPHVIDGESDMGEYGKKPGDGAFVSEVILDKNLNVKGKKQFIYVKALDPEKTHYSKALERIDILGTGINVSHLIHELGHAWVSEQDTYTVEGNELINRCGTAYLKSKMIPNGDGTYTRNLVSHEGLMLEEALNTEMEVESLSRYLGKSREETEALYKDGTLIPSNYQGTMSAIAEHLNKTALAEDFRKYRLTGDKKTLDKINEKMMQTEEYKRREESTEESRAKDEVLKNPVSSGIKKFVERCGRDFTRTKENMTPVDMLEDSLQKLYDLSVNKLCFDIFTPECRDQYVALSREAQCESYVLINQTRDLIQGKNQDLSEEQK